LIANFIITILKLNNGKNVVWELSD